MKILIKERQYELLTKVLNESAVPARVLSALTDLLQISRPSYDELARKLTVLVDPNNPMITRRVSRQGSSYNLNTGQDVLAAYMRGHLTDEDAAEVLTYMFKESTDDKLTEAIAKYLVEVADPNFLIKFKNGTLNFNDLTTNYGARQSQSIKNAILAINPIDGRYKSIFGSNLETTDALRIIDDAIVNANNKNVDVVLKGKGLDGKETPFVTSEEILSALIDGRLYDIVKLKTHIINSIPSGPIADSAKKFVKNKIIETYTTAENLRGLERKSVREIEDNLRTNLGITNPDVAKTMWSKLNPLQGAGTGFKQGFTAQGPWDYLVWNRLDSDAVLSTNPLFTKFKSGDKKKLLVWAFTGVGDIGKMKSIYQTYGWPATMWNLGGQYLKAYIASATTVWVLKAFANWISTASSNKEVFPDEVTALQNFFSKENLFENTFIVGIASRILWELGQWMYSVSPGGKLPVFVYQIQDWFKRQIQREEQNMNTLREQLPNLETPSNQNSGTSDPQTPVNTGRD
jgi:hypothetical protein